MTSRIMLSAHLLLVALLCCLACGGCAGPGETQGGLTPMVAATDAAATDAATPSASTISLRISNQSTEVICGVYAAPAGSGKWGDNLLGRVIIEPGEAAAVEVAPGAYDLRAVNCFDVPLAEAFGVDAFASLGWRITAEDPHDE